MTTALARRATRSSLAMGSMHAADAPAVVALWPASGGMSSRSRDMPPSRAIAGAEPMTKSASRRLAGIEVVRSEEPLRCPGLT